MLPITFLIRILTLVVFTDAYAIPIRRVRVPSTRGLYEDLVVHQRHGRFAIRQLDITPSSTAVSATPSVIILSQASLSAETVPTPIITLLPSFSPATSSASTTSSPVASSSSTTNPSNANAPRKYVVAHHMVGNTFPYKQKDWADDIALAHASGIDGFALNIGRDEWQPARVADAYKAALQSGLGFKLFLSLDMSSLPCGSPTDAQALRTIVTTNAAHPNQLQYDSRAFVSTFSGETCTFGQGSAPEGWATQFSGNPELKGKIYFVPAFFIDPAKFTDFADVMDGDFNWNSGWPVELTTSFANSLLSTTSASNKTTKLSNLLGTAPTNATADPELSSLSSNLGSLQNALSKLIGSTDSDELHLNSLAALSNSVNARAEDGDKESGNGKRAYMAAVSPWFFTHYSPETFNKNFIYLTDQHLYSKRWESLIASRDNVDIAQIITWNDYGESHYIGPIKGNQPNSEAWVNGLNHTGWLDMTKHFATAFKTGGFPKIEKDQIIMWARTHPSNAPAPDPVGPPANFELSQDALWALVMATAPSTVTLSTSPTSSKTFSVPSGVSKLEVPLSAGGTMKGVVERDGEVVMELSPGEFVFEGSPGSYNFNAFVVSASAE